MSTLQVQITDGPQAGARFQLNQSPVTFGRSPDNMLVLDVSVVSRHHGELHRDEDGNWTLVNHSQNGTRVGRKKITKKPCPLTNGVAVTIGDTEVFRVHLIEEGQDPATVAPEAEEHDDYQPAGPAPGAGLKGRSKLWIGLGIWFALCIGAMIFFATLKNDDDNTFNPTAGIWNPGQSLTDMDPGPEADKTDVKRLLSQDPPPNDPNEASYTRHIEQARAAVNQGKRGLDTAYRHFQQAISYSTNRDDPLKSLDKIQYNNVLNELSEIIAVEYRDAYRRYNQGDYARARNILDDLRHTFYTTADPDDELANHIKTLRNAAHQQAGG